MFGIKYFQRWFDNLDVMKILAKVLGMFREICKSSHDFFWWVKNIRINRQAARIISGSIIRALRICVSCIRMWYTGRDLYTAIFIHAHYVYIDRISDCHLTCTLKGTGPLHERFRVRFSRWSWRTRSKSHPLLYAKHILSVSRLS